jgi:hypothetical protein
MRISKNRLLKGGEILDGNIPVLKRKSINRPVTRTKIKSSGNGVV